jgi:hypothetical protein
MFLHYLLISPSLSSLQTNSTHYSAPPSVIFTYLQFPHPLFRATITLLARLLARKEWFGEEG